MSNNEYLAKQHELSDLQYPEKEYLDFINNLDRLLDGYLKLTSTARADLLDEILVLIFGD